MESAFDQKKKKKDKKRHLLVNNLFNIFRNVKMVFNIYYRSKVLQVWRKNPDFFKVGTFEILYLYLPCCKTVVLVKQILKEPRMWSTFHCFSPDKRM